MSGKLDTERNGQKPAKSPIYCRQTPSSRLFGVNIAGYFNSEKGLGEAVRANARAIRAAGIPHVLNNYIDRHSANTDRTLSGFSQRNPFYLNLIQLNAGEASEFHERIGDWYYQWKFNVGFWYWELPDLPAMYHRMFNYYDEIWVASSFVYDCVRKVSPIPVRLFPPSLPPIAALVQPVTRERFGVPKDAFMFLTVFDYWSTLERKNPRGALDAFRRAFGAKGSAVLLVKSSHAAHFPAVAAELRRAAADLPVIFLDEVLPLPELYGLMGLCDAYVSLHRSEGFGMPLAEAMALGKPVIATGYSGNLDFMNERNSLLVRHRPVPLQADAGVYPKGSMWAEPDLDHAALLMRAVVDRADQARALGDAAQRHVLRFLSPDAVGARIKEAVIDISGRVGLVPEAPLPERVVTRLPKPKLFGINVAGFITSETGLGEAVRANIASIQAAGIPHALNNLQVGISEAKDETYTEFASKNPFFINLIQVNASEDFRILREQGDLYYQWKHNIGFWYWELADFSLAYGRNFHLYDEIWTASSFIQEALCKVSPVPVFKIPPSIQPFPEHDPAAARRLFGIEPGTPVFLFNFSFGSCTERKNPLGLARAFRQAFQGRKDVLLIIKSGHSKRHQNELAKLQAELVGLNCLHIDKILPKEDLIALYNAADCYVSLHRAEGFGLPLAHAMSLGKPVIATGYSGNMDFMTPQNSYLVRYGMATLEKAWGPYPEGARWADPDLSHAAELMRFVADDPAGAAAVGARARREILSQLDPALLGKLIRQRLEAVFVARGLRIDQEPASPAGAGSSSGSHA